MSSKSKKPSTPVVPKPKFALGQKVFIIKEHRGKPDEIQQVEISSIEVRKYRKTDFLGKLTEPDTYISYSITVPPDKPGWCCSSSASEKDIYASFFEVAKVFAKSFLTLL